MLPPIIEYQQDQKTDSKHTVEEAMTAALVRKCNNCQKPFLKEDGCNMIYCACGNKQCDVCSENVKGYEHFDRAQNGTGKGNLKCPLYDDAAKRSKEEVSAAQVEAVTRVLQDRTDLTAEEVTVDKSMSDYVKPATSGLPSAGKTRNRDAPGLDLLRHQEMERYLVQAEINQEELRQATERERQMLERAGRAAREQRRLAEQKKQQELQRYISDAKGYELEQMARQHQGFISVMDDNKFRRISSLINLAVQAAQRLSQEAEARRRSSSLRALQLQKEKENALKQR